MSKILNNKLILGTVQMGVSYGINNTIGKVTLNDSFKILEHAFDNGIQTLDTAEAYGNAHEVVGLFHERKPNKIFRVITKLPNVINDDIVNKVDGYLNDLKVARLDTLMFHSYKSYFDNIDNFDVLKKLKQEGKINNLGVSIYTNEEVEQVILNDDVDTIQLPFNLFDNINLRKDILEKAKSEGKIIHTRSALLQGLFFKTSEDPSIIVQKLKNELVILSDISKSTGISISELALSYCLKQKNIDQVLIGVDSIEQLKDNLNAATHEISQEVLDRIEDIRIQNLNLLNPSLWN